MANLSNINNKFLFTDGDFLKIGNLAPINNISGSESGISVTNSNVASITLDSTAASGKRYVMYSSGNGSLVFWDSDASSARLQIDTSGNSTFSGTVETTTLRTDVVNNKANSANIIYRSGTDTLVGGGGLTAKVYIQDGGNVGIGVADPDAKLEIKASGSSTGLTFKTTDAAGNENFFIQDGGRTGVRYYPLTVGQASGTSAASGARFQVVTTAGDFVVMSDGKTGIGTTSPDAKLEVAGGSTGIRLSNVGDSGAYDSVEMTYNGYNSGTPEMKFRPTQTPGSGIVNSYFRFINSNGSSTTSNNKANVTIDGNVGINQTSPSFKLDVNGTGYFSDLLRVDEPVYSYTNSGTKHYTHLATGSLYGSGASAAIITTNIPGHNISGNGNMFSFKIVGYAYTMGIIDMTVGMYAGENNYYSVYWSGTCQDNWIGNVYVFTNSAGAVCIQLGEVTDALNCEIAVTDFVQGFGNVNANYSKGWSIAAVTTLPTQYQKTTLNYKTILPDVYEDVTFHDKVGIGTTLPGSKLEVKEGHTILGGTQNNYGGNVFTTKLGGYGVLSSGTDRYGSYGWLAFNSNNNYTGGARAFAFTNAYKANEFALLMGTSDQAPPTLGASGVVTNGQLVFHVNSSADFMFGKVAGDGNGPHLQVNSYGYSSTFQGTSTSNILTIKSGTGLSANVGMIIFRDNGNNASGQITTNAATNTTSYNTSGSDERLKKNITDWNESVLSKFEDLKPKKFNFKTQSDDADKILGYIAQNEVDKFPEAYPLVEDEITGEKIYQFNPAGMSVYLMKAIQELKAEVELLKSK